MDRNSRLAGVWACLRLGADPLKDGEALGQVTDKGAPFNPVPFSGKSGRQPDLPKFSARRRVPERI
jgi:hypothetical protein